MATELTSIQQLIDVSTAIIETPSLSIRDFGIKHEKNSNKLIWSRDVKAAAFATHGALAKNIASSACVGTAVVIGFSELTSFGLAALDGVGAATAGLSTIPIIGWTTAAALIATYGISKYRKAKKEEQEKERISREIIKKQQEAINKQKDAEKELEALLSDIESTNRQNEMKIQELKQQIDNLTELIELLKMQSKNFNAA